MAPAAEVEAVSSAAAGAEMAFVVAAALCSVQSHAQQATAQVGRAPGSVRVAAVSKTKLMPVIRGIYDVGHRCLGENYV